MATMYCCKVLHKGEEKSFALFSDETPTSAMYAFADKCVDEGADNAKIIHLDNGVVLYDVQEDLHFDLGVDDEMGYNPYMGCYDFDC